jgi:hypothetical protein
MGAPRRARFMHAVPHTLRAFGRAAVLLLAAVTAAAQAFDPGDFEARADYAFFTEDANALGNLIRDARADFEKNPPDANGRYALAFAHYRLGRLLAESDESGAAARMSSCIDELDEALRGGGTAEANALQSACYAQLSALRGWSAVLTARQSSARLEKALALDARNPRVVLVDALNDLARPRALGGDRARGVSKLQRAVELFEASDATAAGPAWGQADAWLMLGTILLEAGDKLAARNALERALLVAPEYAAARRLLAKVAGTAR